MPHTWLGTGIQIGFVLIPVYSLLDTTAAGLKPCVRGWLELLFAATACRLAKTK